MGLKPPMDEHPKVAGAEHRILDVIRQRWSPRAFDPDRAVDRDELWRLFEAARWSPSSYNAQPWRFVVIDRSRHPGAHAALFASLLGHNPGWAAAAPVLVLVAVHLTLEGTGTANTHAWYDTGQAVALLALQATEQGLGVRQMQGFDASVARAACAVPGDYEPAVVMAVGYPGDPASLTVQSHRDAERRPRARRPARDFVFEATWGAPLS
jgi:nitroreductase